MIRSNHWSGQFESLEWLDLTTPVERFNYLCYIKQKNVTKNGTLKSTIKPWKRETMTNFCPAVCVMIGRVVSIVVAPPEEIGARLPNHRTISGAHSKVIISRAIFDNKATVPNSAPLYSVMKMLDRE